MTALKFLLILCLGFAAASDLRADQAAVRVEPMNLQGPRPLSDQSKAAVIRDYLQAWQGFHAAMEQNRPELLEADFVGTAKDKLSDTVQQQGKLGIQTRYQDRSHDLQIVFYSPDGMSVELADKVAFDVQVVDHGNVIATQRESARYLIVLTPTEVRWRVRVFQSTPE
jgi:hypothetical protein